MLEGTGSHHIRFWNLGEEANYDNLPLLSSLLISFRVDFEAHVLGVKYEKDRELICC